VFVDFPRIKRTVVLNHVPLTGLPMPKLTKRTIDATEPRATNNARHPTSSRL
jgi:hypothetical protein